MYYLFQCYIHNMKYRNNEYKCKHYDDLLELLGETAQHKFMKLKENSIGF